MPDEPGGASPKGPAPDDEGRRRRGRVSLSTVSRVVNGSPPVAPELAVKVQRAVELLGYRHNHTAGTLRRANRLSASLGLIFEDVSNPFFSAIHRGVEEVARARSVVTFAGSSDEDPVRERELIEALLARRVDGLIVVPTASDHSYLLRDVATGVAVVFVDRPPQTIDADCVLSDNRAGAEAAVAHLIAHGHRRIAFIGYPPVLHTSVERLAGYRDALRRAGIAEELVHHPIEAWRGVLDGGFTAGGADGPTALFTSQNLITVEVLRALHRLGASTRSRWSRSTTSCSPARSSRPSRSPPRTRWGSGVPPPSCSSHASTATRGRRGGSCSASK